MSEPTEPAEIRNGLAVYQRGQGRPLLALPYPHASGGGPMIDGPLVSLAAGCGFQVSTFDPPGQYRSTRPARVSLDEMVDCAIETLGTLALPARVAVIGHSMSALCAFYLGLAHPERVAKLVLVGTPPGSGMAIVRYRAMPFHWPPWNPNLWRMAGWGILLASGHGSLATHKKMDLLSDRANFVNQALVSPIVIEPGDRHRPAPPRDRWWHAIRKARVISRASELRCCTAGSRCHQAAIVAAPRRAGIRGDLRPRCRRAEQRAGPAPAPVSAVADLARPHHRGLLGAVAARPPHPARAAQRQRPG